MFSLFKVLSKTYNGEIHEIRNIRNMTILFLIVFVVFAEIAAGFEKQSSRKIVIAKKKDSVLGPGHFFLPDSSVLLQIVDHNSTAVSNSSEWIWEELGRSVNLQPCYRYDTCKDRCLEYQKNTETIADTEHFNCNCDKDCKIFRDCCWDYHDECVLSPVKENQETDTLDFSIFDANSKMNPPNSKAFECVVVDKYSKEYFWVITKCATTWPNDEIRHKCISNEVDILNLLPVFGDTGWTYRNAFCAQCNYIDNFQYWKISAQCFQNAPKEVLAGSSAMISYYLLHFCNIGLSRNFSTPLTNPKNLTDLSEQNSLNKSLIKSKYTYGFSLRRCDRDVIRKCPDNYTDKFIIALCEEYQSIVLHRDYVNGELQTFQLFKNPVCAYCNGITSIYNDVLSHPMPSPVPVAQNIQHKGDTVFLDAFQDRMWSAPTDIQRYPLLECPIWLSMKYYDQPYWSISAQSDAKLMLPTFNSDAATRSSWTPPSFSMLLHFRKDGSCEIDYTQEGNCSTMSITPDLVCGEGEIYDPFYAMCRPVLCQSNENYNSSGCSPELTHATDSVNPETREEMPLAATVTLTIEIPVEQLHINKTEYDYPTTTINQMSSAIERSFNTSVTNVTIVNITMINSSTTNVNSSSAEKAINDKSYVMIFTFVLVDPDSYSDEDIIEFVNKMDNVVQYQKLLLEADFLTVLVLSTPHAGHVYLNCADGTRQLHYKADEYEIIEWENRYILHINETDEYYLESEYQFLDWSVTITENGTDRTYVENSRVIVCAETPDMIVYECDIWVPLNQSEYVVLENGDLYLMDRNKTIPSEESITYRDTYAVCADKYMTRNSTNTQTTESAKNGWVDVGIWVIFGLSMLSLIALAVTFLTYVLFGDLRTVAGCCIMNLVAAQFISVGLFMFGANLTTHPTTCTVVAILLHFFFLSIFFWNNVMAFDVWWTFGNGLKNSLRRSLQNRHRSSNGTPSPAKIVYKYMLYAWGVPFVIVGSSVAVEYLSTIIVGYIYDPAFGLCWISNATANIIVFGVPIFCILVANSVLFGFTVFSIRGSVKQQRKAVKSERLCSNVASVSSDISDHVTLTPSERRNRVYYSNHIHSSIHSNPALCTEEDSVFEEERPQSDPNARELSEASEKKSSKRIHIHPEVRVSRNRVRSNVGIYIKMSTVMGFSWILGFTASFTQLMVLWSLFEISVPLQGIFIMWAFIGKKKIWTRYRRCCRKKKFNAD